MSTPPSRSTTYTRNDSGFLLQEVDAVGATSEFVRDFEGKPTGVRVTVQPGLIKTTGYTYNRRGQLRKQTDPRGTGNAFPVTSQTYTGFGEPK
jgi:hypothetical protein